MNMLFPRGAGDVVSEPLPSPVIPTDPGVINPAVPPPAPVAPAPAAAPVVTPSPAPVAVAAPVAPPPAAPVNIANVEPPAYNPAAPPNPAAPTSNPYAPAPPPAAPVAPPPAAPTVPSDPNYVSSLSQRVNEPIPTNLFPREPVPEPTAAPVAPTLPPDPTIEAQQQAVAAERAQLNQHREQLWQQALASVGTPPVDPNAPPPPVPPGTAPVAPTTVPVTPTADPNAAPTGFPRVELDPNRLDTNELYLGNAVNQMGDYVQTLQQHIQQQDQRQQQLHEQQVNDQMLRQVDGASQQFGVPREDIYAMYEIYQVPDPYALAELAAGRRLQHERLNENTAQAVDARVDAASMVGGGTPSPAPVSTEVPGRGVANPFDPVEVSQKYRAFGATA